VSAKEFLKKNVAFVIVGVASVVFVRVEPFRSNFFLAVLAGFAVGLICAAGEAAVRKIATVSRSKKTTPG